MFLGSCQRLVGLEQDRQRLQPKVVEAVNRLESKGVLRQLRRFAKTLQREAGSEVKTPGAKVKTRDHILQRLDDLIERARSLTDADDQQGHHKMRIAAKRLRYTVEIARPVYPGQLDEPLECVKRVQSLLGDVHDCDVWAVQLDAFEARQCRRLTRWFGHSGRMTRLQSGIDYLRGNRRRHREEVFGQLVQYWADLERGRFWDGLRAIVDGWPTAGAPPDSAASETGVAARLSEPVSSPLGPVQPPPGNGLHEVGKPSPEPPLTVGSR